MIHTYMHTQLKYLKMSIFYAASVCKHNGVISNWQCFLFVMWSYHDLPSISWQNQADLSGVFHPASITLLVSRAGNTPYFVPTYKIYCKLFIQVNKCMTQRSDREGVVTKIIGLWVHAGDCVSIQSGATFQTMLCSSICREGVICWTQWSLERLLLHHDYFGRWVCQSLSSSQWC